MQNERIAGLGRIVGLVAGGAGDAALMIWTGRDRPKVKTSVPENPPDFGEDGFSLLRRVGRGQNLSDEDRLEIIQKDGERLVCAFGDRKIIEGRGVFTVYVDENDQEITRLICEDNVSSWRKLTL